MRWLRGSVQHYDWGDTKFIPDFLAAPADGRPWSELWFGTHVGGRSTVETSKGQLSLAQLCGELSFLVKIISAAKPLSLQAHPTDDQAAVGYCRENESDIPLDAPQRIYRDASAKPELLVALSEFEAICGFRPLEETIWLCKKFGWTELGQRLEANGLAECVRWALCEGPHNLPSQLPQWAERLADLYPGSPGVLVALLMHHVRLKAGQALFLGPGVAHSYLSGSGVEVMSSSDNVVRAAFTSKHVAIEEFLAIADIRSVPSPIFEPNDIGADRYAYPVDTPRFGVERIDVAGEQTIEAVHRAEILLCTSGDATAIRRGQAGVLLIGESVRLKGTATVFRTWGDN